MSTKSKLIVVLMLRITIRNRNIGIRKNENND